MENFDDNFRLSVDVCCRGTTREAGRGKDAIDDCLAAIDFLGEQGLLDPSRAVIRGSGSGCVDVLSSLMIQHPTTRFVSSLSRANCHGGFESRVLLRLSRQPPAHSQHDDWQQCSLDVGTACHRRDVLVCVNS